MIRRTTVQMKEEEISEGLDSLSALGSDDVFCETRTCASDEDGDGVEDDGESREPLINRIDSLRETRIKVGKMKKTSMKRHVKASNSLQQTFTLELAEADFETQIPAKRGFTLKQAALPCFVHHNLPDFFAFDFFLSGSNTALPLHAHCDLLAGSRIFAKRKEHFGAFDYREKERKKRSSAGVSPSTSTSNLMVPDLPRQRRASFGFLYLPSSPRASDIDHNETAEGLLDHKKSNVRISHAASLQHLVIKDFDHPEMPSGTLPRIKSQSNTFSRLTRILSPSKERLDRLNDTLEAFNTTGIPLTCSPTVNPNKFHVKPKWLEMETSWEEIVENSQSLTEQQIHQQSAIWELLCTEADYIRRLKSVVETHISALNHLQGSTERLLVEVDAQKLFANFEEVYVANGLFWQNHFLKTLRTSRANKCPLRIDDLHDGFIRIARLFSPYISFCINTGNCRRYLREKETNSPFHTFIRWADQKIVSEDNRLGFRDHLYKPFQRITRYKLLLERIKNLTTDETQKNKLNDMVASVAAFVENVNEHVKATQKFEELVETANRLDYSLPTESPGEEFLRTADRFVTFNLLQPMQHNHNFREVLHEGPLRIRDHQQTRWAEVFGFLFTDMLLIVKNKRRDRFKVIRAPFKLDRILIERYNESPPQFCLYILDEFGFLRSILVISGLTQNLRPWVAKIEEAKTALAQGASGINPSKVSETLLNEAAPPTMVPTVSNLQNESLSSSMYTLSITDMRRRFQTPKSSSTVTSDLPSPVQRNSNSSFEGEELQDEKEREEDDEVEDDEEEKELNLEDSCSLSPCSRQASRFLRTASPVQRRQQQQLRLHGCSPPDPIDSPLDDIPSDMAFRNRRGDRGDRRYRTADSLVPPRSHSIHKRFSLNYRGQGTEVPANLPPTSPTGPGLPATSVESFQSSSGFSSSGSAQHLHSGSELSEPGHELRFEPPGPDSCVGSPPSGGALMNSTGRDRVKKIISRHCMSLNDISRVGLDPISDTNDNDEDSPEGNSSSTSVRSVLKQYFVLQSSDGEGTDV